MTAPPFQDQIDVVNSDFTHLLDPSVVIARLTELQGSERTGASREE